MKGYRLLPGQHLMDHSVHKSRTKGQRIMNLYSQPADKPAAAHKVSAPEFRFPSKGLNMWSPLSAVPSI